MAAAAPLRRGRSTGDACTQQELRRLGRFRWPVSDGGWALSGRRPRPIPERIQHAAQFGHFGQFWNHRTPSSCAICASTSREQSHDSTAGRIISRPPSRPRRANQVLLDPYVLFSGQTGQTGQAMRIRGFLRSFSWPVLPCWPVSSPGSSDPAASALIRRWSRSRREPWIVKRTVQPRAWSRDARSPCSAKRFQSVRCLIGMLVP